MVKEKIFGTVETSKKVGIEMHRLYAWEQYGIVNPILKRFGVRQFRRYSQKDIMRALFIKNLVDEEGYTLKAAVRKLDSNSIKNSRI